jgi:hypothetical protein
MVSGSPVKVIQIFWRAAPAAASCSAIKNPLREIGMMKMPTKISIGTNCKRTQIHEQQQKQHAL